MEHSEMLTRKNLYSLEEYAEKRRDFRTRVMAHKKNRHLQVGEHVRLLFEDQLTIQYQIQEMLRVEKIFDATGIQEEIDAYNPLIPDGNNWKATMMIEYADVAERKHMLAQLVGIEDLVWVRIEGFGKVMAVADEDMERSTGEKTASVHFLQFPLSDEMITAAKSNLPISVGVDHPHYTEIVAPLPDNIRLSLISDLA
jgi:Protein of unknown function (DUF3501)